MINRIASLKDKVLPFLLCIATQSFTGTAQSAVPSASSAPASHPHSLATVKDKLFFAANDGIHGDELWAWCPLGEGPRGECRLVADLVEGPEGSKPSSLIDCGSWLYFKAKAPGGVESYFLCDSDSLNVQVLMNSEGAPLTTGGMRNVTPLLAGEGVCYLASFLFPKGVAPKDDPEANTGRLYRGQLGEAAFDAVLDFQAFYPLGVRDGCVVASQTVLLPSARGLFAFNGAKGVTRILENDLRDARNLRKLGSGALFVAVTSETGAELWFTDGSSENTRFVKDIAPGTDSSSIGGFCSFDGRALFQATDSVHGTELWITDGTTEGTQLVRDINPGHASSSPFNMCVAGGRAFFGADDGIHGRELWATDGTAEGTVLVGDLYAGPTGSDPWSLEDADGTLYFCASSSVYGEEVFLTDGTETGTRVLRDTTSSLAGSGPHQITYLDGNIFFTCDEPIYGEELWVSDGTDKGTFLVKDIFPSSPNPSASPCELTALGDRVCFVAPSPGVGREIWVSDGTENGTFVLDDIAPGPADSLPESLTACNNRVFFAANDTKSGSELWATGGTPESTVLVCDIRPGGDGSNPECLFPLAEGLLFTADDGEIGREPWYVDAATLSVKRLGDLASGSASSAVVRFFDIEGRAYCWVSDTPTAAVLWRIEPETARAFPVMRTAVPQPVWEGGQTPDEEILPAGSGNETALTERDRLLARLLQPFAASEFHEPPLWLGNTAYFTLYTDAFGAELWRTDGTSEGTRLVQDCYPGPVSSSPAQIRECAGVVYFIAETPGVGRVLWRTDGTREGTSAVRPRNNIEVFRNIRPTEFISAGYGLMMVAVSLTSAHSNLELICLSTATGEYPSIEFKPVSEVFVPSALTRASDNVFFVADDGIHGEELWATSVGLRGQTRMVKDILPAVEERALGYEGG